MRIIRLINLGVISSLIVISFSLSADAFDGKRKGFVAGLGIGYAPVINSTSDTARADVSESGVGVNLIGGFAWNNSDLLALESAGTVYFLSGTMDEGVIHVFRSIRWYHYWGTTKRQLFTMVGIGWFSSGSKYENIGGTGFGYTAGIGYEFLKQLQIGVYYIGAHTSNDYGVSANHSIINVLITLVAY